MTIRHPYVSLVIAATFVSTATAVVAVQQPPSVTASRSLTLSSSSERAKTLFREAWLYSQTLWPEQARATIVESVKADPRFALAQAFDAFVSTASGPEREKTIAGVLAKMSSATLPELLLASYWRESTGGRAAAAAPLLRALADLAPADAEIAWMYNGVVRTGEPPARQAAIIREHLKRFPGHAAALNTLAYVLHNAGETEAGLQAALEQVKRLPTHRNALDTLADFYLLLRRPSDAAAIVERELKVAPDFTGALTKRGAIVMMADGPVKARAEFERTLGRVTTPAAKLALMNWLVATDMYAGNGKAALAELSRVIALAESERLPGEAAVAHDRAAIVEAFLGDRAAVRGHIAAAAAGTPPALHFVAEAIALARIGDCAAARAALARYQSMVTPPTPQQYSVAAYVALCANDLPAAEQALGLASSVDLLAKAVRADLAGRRGQKNEADALRREVTTSSVKQDGNPPPDSMKLVARLLVEKM